MKPPNGTVTSVEDQDYINWNQYVLPYDYGDAEFEYHALRNSCALCDVTPMCMIRVRGANAGHFLDHLVTRPVSQLGPMRTTYMMMPSDIDHTAYFESLRDSLGITKVTFEECTDDWCGLAIQGPRSAAVMQQLGFDGAQELAPFEVRDYQRERR